MQGLYIHIPFCVSKCAYCDFVSFAGKTDCIDAYLDCLLREAELYKNVPKIQTLYVGGGTPSLLSPAQAEKLFRGISLAFGDTRMLKDVSFECNPESITEEKMKYLKIFGVTRLSIGMQTTCDKHLKLIGRAHNRKQFFKAYEIAAKYFDNINIDIIAALPKQSLEDFKTSLRETAALNPKHISVYGLQVEEGTPLFERGFRADENLCRKMLEFTCEHLCAACGYEQYEISNYCKPGAECQHNINYWEEGPYVGLGVSAASYINGVRMQNTNDMDEYMRLVSAKQPAVNFKEELTGKAKTGEEILLALRMMKGVEPTPKMKQFFEDDFLALIDQGLLESSGVALHLTNEGKYMANEVFRHFVEPF